jgi:Icc-related predicted phosphoesterase
MKIVFLHLSDLHLTDLSGANPNRIHAAVQSLLSLGQFDGIVFIVSGDLAAKGSSNEYKNAAIFLGRFTSAIKNTFSILEQNLKILIVPGNHDLKYGATVRATPEEIRAYDDAEKELHLVNELDRMADFFQFADSNKCFFKEKTIPYGQLITRKILHFSTGYKIEANLLNTAPFSCGADDGLHFLPEDAIQQLSLPSTADMSITVMHHSPDWFGFSQRKELEGIISRRCSMAFFGHEHTPGTQHVLYDNGSQIVMQDGGAWWDTSAPNVSEYYAGLFDSDSRKYVLHRFTWDNTAMHYGSKTPQEFTLMVKPMNGCGLLYRTDYISNLMNDDKHAISSTIEDYFVFPNLRTNASKEYSNSQSIRNMEDLIAYIKRNKYVAIVGGSNSGKTMLMKMVFKSMQTHMPVLYCGTDDITGRSQANIIKELVLNTYGENAYPDFLQVDSSPKAIIIDDLHRISTKHLEKFLRGIENSFDIIVVATEESGKFDVVQMVKDNINTQNEFKKVYISRLYAEKRLEIISKVVSLKYNGDEIRVKNVVRTLEQCLNTYKLAFRTEVDFVVQYANYYCSHIGELDKSDATVFSKVFESSIEQAISANLIGREENTGDIVVALSEIAFYIHFHQEYPISATRIDEVIKAYSDYYDNTYLTSARFIEIAEKSGLIIRTASGFDYRLKSKNHLAYLVAKALNRRFNDDGNDEYLRQIVEHSCFGINSDILMFLTYISDNVRIPRLLLSQAIQHVHDWEEFNIRDKNVKYLQEMPVNRLSPPVENQKTEEVRELAKVEEMIDDPIETLDLYDYNVEEIDDLSNQLIKAFLQLKIVARSLSAFISILPATDKRDLVCAMYQMPNRIFSKWAQAVDDNIHGLIDDIMKWQDDPKYTGKHHTREDILKFFQDISVNTLLNLYYLVTAHGVNNATVGYLSSQEYVADSLMYRLERMMFYEKVDDYRSLIQESEDIFNRFDDGVTRNIVLSILNHLAVHSDRIPDRERRRIISKYFSQKDQTRIYLYRQKALNA